MNFIKKNYEKILLGAVLLGLFGAVLSLPVVIAADKKAEKDAEEIIVNTAPKPLKPLDMSAESGVLNRVQAPYSLDFETTNRLFNPMKWQKTSDGRLFPIKNGNEVGPGAVKIMNIRPLYFVLKLDSVEPSNQFSAARYVISMQRQSSPNPGQRNARDTYISVGEKNAAFSLLSASGQPDNPQLAIQIVDSGETINLTTNQPYQHVDGYMADLTYPPDPRDKWNNVRVEDILKNIDGDNYIVVVIDKNEVVISAESNQKKTTLTYQP